MPLNPAKVGLAVQSGLSVVCATCTHYWRGRDNGLPEPKCTTPRPCGSPLAGSTFPEYQGPITEFGRWCFVCGSNAKYGVRLGESKVFGMCADHIKLMEQLRPVGLNGTPASEVIASSKSALDFLKVKPKKSLASAIMDAEAEREGSG